MRRNAFLCLLLLPTAAALHAQHFNVSACTTSNGGSSNGSWFGGQERACEVRSTVLPANGPVKVSNTNGAIDVIGEDRSDVALEARVEAQASSQSNADALLHQVQVITDGGIHAEGPQNNGFFHNGSWSVSYKLRVPRRVAAQLNTSNGSVSVNDVEGGVDAAAVNGALHLASVSGDVQAHTVNGSIAIALSGTHWRGGGLSAKTVNGHISLKAPDGFGAHLVAQTVNGAIAVGFPMTVSETNRHHIDTNIGSGGPTLDLQTVNGGIAIDRGGNAGQAQREE